MRLLATLLGIVGIFLIGFGLSQTEVSGQVKSLLRESSPEVKDSTHRAGVRLMQFLRTSDSEPLPFETKSNGADDAPTSNMKKRYDYFQKCLQAEFGACSTFDTSGEREYYSDIYRMSAYEFSRHAQYLKTHLEARTKEEEALARELLIDASTRVQLTGLNILSLFPPSQENLKAVVAPLSVTLSSDLLEAGFKVLSQYRDVPGFNREMQKLFAYQIRLGTTETSQTATRALFQFMNPESYLFFDEKRKEYRAEILETESPAIKSRLMNLDSVLREYERLHLIQSQ